MAQVINVRFRVRRRTAAGWTSINEVLLASELGHESDTDKMKIGDGVTAWNDLPYFPPDVAPTTGFDLATAWAMT